MDGRLGRMGILSSRRRREGLLLVVHEVRRRAEELRGLRVEVLEGCRASLMKGLVDFGLGGEAFLKKGVLVS